MRAVETQGVGLHSGVPVKLRLTPAPAATGIVFRRTDLDNFEIPASWRYVQKVSYATSLMRQGVLISTTEHLLSTLYSMGIDNAYVEIDNLEVPILDGSGLPFVELLRQAGIRQTRRRRHYLRVLEPVHIEGNGKRIAIYPADTFGSDLPASSSRIRKSVSASLGPAGHARDVTRGKSHLRALSASTGNSSRCRTWA